MSAVDFVARALALRAIGKVEQTGSGTGGASDASDTSATTSSSADLRLTFAQMKQAAPSGVSPVIESAGHGSVGVGQAVYGSDTLATAELAAAHPRACFTAQNGKIYRLLGDSEGFITPEQVGCPASASGVNQQPAIQAALDYCRATGLNGVKFPQQRYELWAPVRTGEYSDDGDHSGCFLVVGGWPCSLRGVHPLRTTLDCKGPGGGSLQGDYQVISSAQHGGDVIWRGHGIKLAGSVPLTHATPPAHQLASVLLRHVVLRTDAVAVGNTASPAYPPSRNASRVNCRDLSNSAITCQANVHIGDICTDDCELTGFLGDAIQSPAGYTAKVQLRSSVVRHANGFALNLAGPRCLEVADFVAENCGFSLGGFSGLDSSALKARFTRCGSGGLDSAKALPSGMRSDGNAPLHHLEVTFESCGEQRLGSHTIGTITAIDTPVALALANVAQVVRNVDISLTSIVHKANVPYAIRYAGWNGVISAVAYTQVRLNMQRTANAMTNGFTIAVMMAQSGSLGQGNYLYARGAPSRVSTANKVLDNYVALIDEGLELKPTTALTTFDPSTTPYPDMSNPALLCSTFSAGNGVYSVNLPSPSMYQDGAQILIEHHEFTRQQSCVEFMDGYVRRALLGYKDRVVFRCNKQLNRWDLLRAPTPRTSGAMIALPRTEPGAETGPHSIAAPGCRPWHQVDVTPYGPLNDFCISAVRAENDVIQFWAKNITGTSAMQLASQAFFARYGITPN